MFGRQGVNIVGKSQSLVFKYWAKLTRKIKTVSNIGHLVFFLYLRKELSFMVLTAMGFSIRM